MQERAEIGPVEDEGDDMALTLRDALMSDLPGLPSISHTPAPAKKTPKRSTASQALPPASAIPLLELPSWPPKEKRPRRACVARANYKSAFQDGKGRT